MNQRLLRKARRRLGTRSARRSGTNGKNIPGRPTGQSGRVLFKYLHPRKPKRLKPQVHKIYANLEGLK